MINAMKYVEISQPQLTRKLAKTYLIKYSFLKSAYATLTF